MELIRERSWPAVIVTPITVSGDKVVVPSAVGLHPKQQITISNGSLEPLLLEIKRIVDPVTIQVGPSSKYGSDPAQVRKGGSLKEITSVPVGYNGGTLIAEQQGRSSISSEAIFSAVYAEEPTVALRTSLVDYWGQNYDAANPLPTIPQGGAADKVWDELVMDYDPVTQDMTKATYKLAGINVRVLDLEYDLYSNLTHVVKT